MFTDSYIHCTEIDEGLTVPVNNLADYGGCAYIASPHYPYIYTDSSNCHWSFQASDPSLVIQIEVIEWEVCYLSHNKVWINDKVGCKISLE